MQRDGLMPADPSACSPGVSQSTFSVSSTQCGAQVEAKARTGGALRWWLMREASIKIEIKGKLRLACDLWMRIHPTVHPPVLQLGPVCTLSTHDECVGVVGWLSPAGGWLKRVVAGFKNRSLYWRYRRLQVESTRCL